mgnify:FL=1
MKTKIKYRLLRIGVVVRSFFKHDCLDYKEVTSRGYFIDGDSGVAFATGVNCKCGKCGKKWTE